MQQGAASVHPETGQSLSMFEIGPNAIGVGK